MKLSIIIPVYNVENYIEDCIQSCIENIGLKSDDVEVIVVDDGSKDRSIDIVRDLVAEIPYFRIITQQNQGLSLARNNGMEEAKGDYVWFIDSDDFIRKGIVDVILKQLSVYPKVDMISLMSGDVEENVDRSKLEGITNGKNVDCKVLGGRERFVKGFNVCVPFHIFRRQYLKEHNLKMHPGIYYEDCEFTPRAVWLADKVLVVKEIAYYYRHRSNSIKSSVNPKKGVDSILVSKRLQDFFYYQPMSENEEVKVYNMISMFYCNGLNIAVGADKDTKKIIGAQATTNADVLKVLRKSDSFKYRALGYLGALMPKKILSLYLALMKFKTNK